MKLCELDTPSLLVDLDQMESNLRAMQTFMTNSNHVLRPHTKAHKIPDIAKLQLKYGAKGICTAKLGEAEVMAAHGLDDILITTPIANPLKVERLIKLVKNYKTGRFIQVVDDAQQVQTIAAAAKASGATVDLLVEVECGQNRCGVQLGDSLVELIKLINQLPDVNYTGLQAYTGHLQHVRGYDERAEQARQAVRPVFDFIARRLDDGQLRPEIISGGGTGTYDAYSDLPFTEIQAGSYIFMDGDYQSIGSKDGQSTYGDFSCSLSVWTTVISRPIPSRCVVDAGMKALSIDSGMPLPIEHNATYKSGGDEHGILSVSEDNDSLQVGSRLRILPSHCDTTLNQFSKLYGHRGDTIEKEWDILGRGRSD